jgi:NAD(P)H-hydrate epimerase
LLDEITAVHEVGVIRGDEDPGEERLRGALASCDCVIDALLGIGQKRSIDADEAIGRALALLKEARAAFTPPKLIAVDLPTGINADTGEADPHTVVPDMTVTFGLPKVGMYQAPASALLGRVQVIDIGIPKAAQDAVQLELLTSRWARSVLPRRPEDANKGTFGRVIVVGGSARYVGAPRLAGEAAYRAGAGLLTIACPADLVPAIAPALPECTWLPQDVSETGGLPGETAIALRSHWTTFDAAVVGPGLGNDEETRAFTWAVLPDLAELPRGCVLDADALNAIAGFTDDPPRVPANAVLTPHPGELARLLHTTVAGIQARRMAAGEEAAKKYGCTVVLKGAHSVIAASDGRRALSPFANPLLATAGSGDVLAGVIAAYLAQGLEPFAAACLGVYVHAATGEALREDYGDSGLLASELSARLPRVVKEMRGE